MENNPFGNNAESDDSNQWEVTDADLKGEKEESEEKKEKPKRNLFESTKDRRKREEAEAAEKKPTLFESLLQGDEEKDADDEDTKAEKSLFGAEAAEVEEPLVDAQPATSEATAAQFEELVEDKLDAIDHEIVDSGEPTKVGELLADADLLENVSEKLDEGQDPVKAIDNATEEILENPLPDAGQEDILQSVDPFEAVEPTIEPDTEPDEPAKSTATATPSTPPVTTIPPVYSANVPTMNTVNSNAYFNTTPSTPDVAPEPDPELVPMNDSFDREPNTGKVIASGVLGYMLGRRGGRKRTEAKLQPVIDTQQEELQELNQKLETSEDKVKIVAAKEAEVAARNAKLEAEANTAVDASTRTAETIAQEREEFAAREKELEKSIDEEEKAKKAEAELADRQQKDALKETEDSLQILRQERAKEAAAIDAAVEQLGIQNRVETEEEKRQEKARVAAATELKAKEKSRLQEAKRQTDARQMTLPRVLEVAEFIPLKNNMNLRQMYEAKRIDAVNLRRVVHEYMNGGSFEKALESSLEAVELRSELKHEVKQDNSIYKQPDTTAHGVVDGLIAATGGSSTQASEATTSGRSGDEQTQNSASIPQTQTEDTGLVISNGTAIILGIGAGVVIMILILLYSGSL